MKRGVLLTLLAAACASDAPAGARPSEAELRSSNVCEFRDGGSRWAPALARYERVAEFGRGEDEFLDFQPSIATSPAGDIFVYDKGHTRVLKLDGDLRLIETVGREGQGPGEFTYQFVVGGNWIAADDSSIFVLDLRVLSRFDLHGEFLGYAANEVPSYGTERVRWIAVSHGRVVYAVDRIDFVDGDRLLQTWRFESSRPRNTLLRTDTVPTLPVSNGRPVISTNLILQADPLWAVHGRCAFISDGAGDWILRVDLATNRADTLHLPSRAIPELAEADRERQEEIRRMMGMVGTRRQDEVKPTARRKWENIIVDPDGYIWLEPWRPHSMRDEPLTAWIVHPATGAVDSVVVERFPDAFLPDGAFVARTYDRTVDLTLVRKYTLDRRDGGRRSLPGPPISLAPESRDLSAAPVPLR